jgi:hypothetical protein
MIFNISGISDPGNLAKERLVLKVVADGDLNDYAVFRAFSHEKTVLSGNIPNAFWFSPVKLEVGDLVVLYTKGGTDSEKRLPSGRMTYFFYWGLDEPIWESSEYSAVVVQTESWKLFKRS